jgi:uncharacterized protein YycO
MEYFGPCPGDIVVLENEGWRGKINQRLQFWWGRQFTHAILIVSPNTAIHANPDYGVTRDDVWAILNKQSVRRIKAFRSRSIMNGALGSQTRFEEGLLSEARAHVGKKYNWLFYFCRFTRMGCGRAFYCSELVAYLLRTRGVAVTSRSWWRVFPRQLGGLDRSGEWEDVTQLYEELRVRNQRSSG